MAKTSWIGLGFVLVVVAVPLGATGILDSPTVAPDAGPDLPTRTEITIATDNDPPVTQAAPSATAPPVTLPQIGSPSSFSIGPDLTPSLPAYYPPTMPSTVPSPIRPPIGLGGPGIGVGGRGVFVIPR